MAVKGVFTEKPKSGKGRKAWEKYEKQHGKAPASVEYVSNYDHEFKGWICEWYSETPHVNIGSNYDSANYHTFYLSSEL